MISLSDRDQYLAGHVTPQTKDALRIEASRQERSMSELMSLFVEAGLKALGYDLDAPRVDTATPMLPFEPPAAVAEAPAA